MHARMPRLAHTHTRSRWSVSSSRCRFWSGKEDTLVASYLNLLASVNYIFDALFYLLAWYVEKRFVTPVKVLEDVAVDNVSRDYDLVVSELPTWFEKADWTFWGYAHTKL